MGFVNRVDHAGRRMYATAEGVIRVEDIRRHLAVERRDGGLAYAELIDARGACPNVSSADVRTVVAWLEGFARENALGPTAIVVSSPLAFGMVRMLDILVEESCVIRPFLDIDEAERWLRDQPAP
jgi:hypothetical protein